MRVLINAASASLGGALTYIQNLLAEIPRVREPEDRFWVVLPERTLSAVSAKVSDEAIALVPYAPQFPGLPGRLLFDHVTLPRLAKRFRADVLFSSTGFGTFFSPCPQLLLVRNSSYFCPLYRRAYREIGASLRENRFRRLHSLVSIRAADMVLFPTEAMRRLVESDVGLRGKPSAVLHYGFSADSFLAESPVPAIAEEMEEWRRQGYRLLLNISHFSVHKNFETLIEGLARLVADGARVRLVCTISDRLLPPGSLYARRYEELLKRIESLGLGESVVHAGHFDHDQVHHLYERADAFAFPSLTESFGQPMVEAMASGLPVVAADTAVNREICGDAAEYFDVFDGEDCARVIADAIDAPDRLATMRARGLERARDFSWAGYTQSLLAILRRLAA